MRTRFGRCGAAVTSIAVVAAFSCTAQGAPTQEARAGTWTSAAATPSGRDVGWDRKRLQQILEEEEPPLEKARALVELIATADDATVGRYAYTLMARSYQEALASGAAADATIEKTLLAPRLPKELVLPELLAACYGLAQAQLAPSLVERCVKTARASPQAGSHEGELARLEGTLAFGRKSWQQASALLAKAAESIGCDQDPMMHLRLARASAERGDKDAACRVARELVVTQPRLPGAREALAACGGDVAQVATALVGEARARLLASRINADLVAPTLPLENSRGEGVDLDLSKTGKVTVLVFFSTWCPHCNAEMPGLVAAARALAVAKETSTRVQFVGVRTSVEREQPNDDFVKRHGIDFTVWVDPVMSLAFARFAKALSIPATLPTVAVLDERGCVRFLLESGDYKEPGRDVRWAVEALTAVPLARPKPME